MKKFNTNKTILLIFLFAVPTVILFGGFITNAKAGPDIPDQEINDQWYWGVEVGDIIMMEMEVYMANTSDPLDNRMFRTIYLINITSIENTTSNQWFPTQEVSEIKVTELYYNLTQDQLLPKPSETYSIATCGFNSTFDLMNIAPVERGWFPQIIPLNKSTGLHTNIIAQELNASFYTAWGPFYGIPKWDIINSGPDWIYFENSSQGYYYNVSFYNNGTIKEAKYNNPLQMGMSPTDIYNTTISLKRVFDYNITDEIEWSVDVGDELYFGDNDKEKMYKVVDINSTTIHLDWSFGDEGEDLIFEQIIADVSLWNETAEEYELQATNSPIARANNFYPIVPWFNEYGMSASSSLLTPMGSKREDFVFLFNNLTKHHYGFDYMFVGDNMVEFGNPSVGDLIKSFWDNTTGVVKMVLTDISFNPQSISFHKNKAVLSGPDVINNFHLESFFTLEWDFNLSLNISDDIELYYTVLPESPIRGSLMFPYQIPNMPGYIDIYSNNRTAINSMNITVGYNEAALSAASIPETSLVPYRANLEEGTWEGAPEAYFKINTTSNIMEAGPMPLVNISYFSIGAGIEYGFTLKEGDYLFFESTGRLINQSNGYTMPYSSLDMLNITNKGEVVMDWFGSNQIMTEINATTIYYNSTLMTLLPSTPEYTIMDFNNNQSATPIQRYYLDVFTAGIPYCLPLRYGQLNIAQAAFALNNTFYSSSEAAMRGLPTWETIITNEMTNRIYFEDVDDGYYMDLYFYENGTINSLDVYSPMYMGEIWIMDVTSTRVFDHNITEGISWSVEAGDDLYYGDMWGEQKFTIVEINETEVNMAEIGVMPYDIYQTFSIVWADRYLWNSSTYNWDYLEGVIMAAANDFFPIMPSDFCGFFGVNDLNHRLILPENTYSTNLVVELAPYLHYWNMDTIINLGPGHIRVEHSLNGSYMETYWNETTGLTQLTAGKMWNWYKTEYEKIAAFRKYVLNLPSSAGTFNIPVSWDLIPDFSGSLIFEKDPSYPVDFLYSAFPVNPTNQTIPEGIPVFFGDFMIYNATQMGSLTDNISIYIKFPSSIDVDNIELKLWRWNTDSYNWEEPPPEELPNIISINSADNSITLTILDTDSNGNPFSHLWAVSYIDTTTTSELPPLEIPGYDLLVLLGVLSLSTIILLRKRLKRKIIF